MINMKNTAALYKCQRGELSLNTLLIIKTVSTVFLNRNNRNLYLQVVRTEKSLQ